MAMFCRFEVTLLVQRGFATLLLVISASAPRAGSQSLRTPTHIPSQKDFIAVNRVVEEARARYPKVESELLWAVIWSESRYDPSAVGTKGEVGLGQLMPNTAAALAVKDRTNIRESVFAVARLLSHLEKKYRGNLRLVLAAYNGGEPNVDACQCVPHPTRDYVNRVEQDRYPFARNIVAYMRAVTAPGGNEEADRLRRELGKKNEEEKRKDDEIRALNGEVSSLKTRVEQAEDQAQHGVPLTQQRAAALLEKIDQLGGQMREYSQKSDDQAREIRELRRTIVDMKSPRRPERTSGEKPQAGTERVEIEKKVNAAMAEGDRYYQNGEYDHAVTAYKTGLALDPANNDLRLRIQGAKNAKAAEAALPQ